MRFGVVCAEFSGFFEVFEGGGIARLGVIVDAQVIVAEAEIGIERDGGFGLVDGLLRHAHLIICPAEVDEGEPGGGVEGRFCELFEDDSCVFVSFEVEIGIAQIILTIEHVGLRFERFFKVFDGVFVLPAPESNESHEMVCLGMIGIVG